MIAQSATNKRRNMRALQVSSLGMPLKYEQLLAGKLTTKAGIATLPSNPISADYS